MDNNAITTENKDQGTAQNNLIKKWIFLKKII